VPIPQILGINDDVTTCECCGRTDLKCTVVLDFDGEITHYGRQCAANALSSPARKYKVSDIDRELDAVKAREMRIARVNALRTELARYETAIAAGETVNRFGVSLESLAAPLRTQLGY